MAGKKTKGKSKSKSKARRAMNRPSRGLKPKPGVYMFKRARQEIISLSQSQGGIWSPSTNGGIGATFAFSLSDLNDVTDFSQLFKYYRINAVRVQMYFSNTNVTQEENNRFSNSNIMVFTDVNQNGLTTGNDDALTYLDSQTSKRRLGIRSDGKPLDYLMRVKQANEVYNTGVNSDYTLQKPQWISTSETGTPHYGMNMLIERCDGDTLSSGFANNQTVRIIYTYYIECKKVQ